MMLFKKRMSITRFRFVEKTDLSEKEVLENLSAYSFDAEAPLIQKEISGFTTVSDPYEGRDFIETEVLHGSYAVAVFRRDSRSVASSAVKREVEKEIAQFMQKTGAKGISRELKNDIKERVTFDLLTQTPFRTELIPFVLDINSGVGYFFSVGSSAYSSFEDIFSRSMGLSIEIIDFGEGDFLSWLWWRLETNEMNQPEGAEITAGTKFSIGNNDGKALSGSASDAEMRLAVANGGDIRKMMIQPIGGDEFLVDVYGRLSGVKINKEELPSEESSSLLPLIARIEESFFVVDKWMAEYRKNPKNISDFYASKTEWALPTICRAAFEDI